MLTAYLIGGRPASEVSWKNYNLGGNVPFKIEASVSAGYKDITSLKNWDEFGTLGGSYVQVRNELILGYVASWGAMGVGEKKLLVRHYVYPSATSTADLDALYPLGERDGYTAEVVLRLNAAGRQIQQSSDGKLHDKTLNPGGIVVTTEVTTDTVMTNVLKPLRPARRSN